MPGFDRTGPEGKGSRTGRGLGKCNPDNNVSTDTQFGRGLGRGLGRNQGGMGRGRRLGGGRGLGRR
ncbi:MAG: DUF5320 domain-containing protein [Marinilabiliaceae bacterium]|nr:DUF5320 domain-containing protein [Marinilabiliaceae bacterium]